MGRYHFLDGASQTKAEQDASGSGEEINQPQQNMKHAGGRPTKFVKELIDKANEYINGGYKREDAVPNIAGLADDLGISRETIYQYIKQHKEFSDIVGKLMTKQERRLLTGGLTKRFGERVTGLMLAKHGYKDESKTESKVNVPELERIGNQIKKWMEK